jgi:hypothetical protein
MQASVSNSELDASLSELTLLLKDEDWEAADRLTADILLLAVAQRLHSGERLLQDTSASHRPHLTAETLATIPCQLLYALDSQWQGASGGHFGFSTQLQIYTEILSSATFDPALRNWATPHPFFESVGWLMLFPVRPIGFLRFYNWLEFDLEAPKGHLPAMWYWHLPGMASLRLGGFSTGQGAGFGDLARLDAMMLRMTRCQQLGG